MLVITNRQQYTTKSFTNTHIYNISVGNYSSTVVVFNKCNRCQLFAEFFQNYDAGQQRHVSRTATQIQNTIKVD